MKDREIVQKFIQRRAQGWTYTRASELGVAKSTLVEWSRKFRFELSSCKFSSSLGKITSA